MNSKLNISKNRFIGGFYIVLIISYFLLMRPNAELSLSLRIMMLAVTFAPVLFDKELFPFTMLCFYGVSSTSFCNVLPATTYYYVIIAVLFYLVYAHKSRFFISAFIVFSCFLLRSLLNFDLDGYLGWFLVVVILADMIKDEKGLESVFLALVIISAFLSILYLMYSGEFIKQYGDQELGIEHSGWINSNAFGAALGAGASLSVAYLTRTIELPRTLLLSIICSITIGLSFVVISLNASRGAFFAFTIPSFFMFMISKSKTWIKLIVGFIVVLFVIWLLRNNVFELLTVRMNEDTFETGGSRTIIWRYKLSQFFNSSNIFELLFGIGYTRCLNLGYFFSTHNDFVTAFIAYGFFGLILFSYVILFYPLKVASKSCKVPITILLIYVFIEGCVLEPFFRGEIYVMMYYVFVLKYALINGKKNKVNEIANR